MLESSGQFKQNQPTNLRIRVSSSASHVSPAVEIIPGNCVRQKGPEAIAASLFLNANEIAQANNDGMIGNWEIISPRKVSRGR